LLAVLKSQQKDEEYINSCVQNVTKYLNEKISTLRKSTTKPTAVARAINFNDLT